MTPPFLRARVCLCVLILLYSFSFSSFHSLKSSLLFFHIQSRYRYIYFHPSSPLLLSLSYFFIHLPSLLSLIHRLLLQFFFFFLVQSLSVPLGLSQSKPRRREVKVLGNSVCCNNGLGGNWKEEKRHVSSRKTWKSLTLRPGQARQREKRIIKKVCGRFE